MPDYFKVLIDAGHELASSSKNAGAFSTNSFNATGDLGRPDLLSADGEIARLLRNNRAIFFAAGLVAGAVAGAVAAPHLKTLWNSVKSKLSGGPAVSEADSSAALDGGADAGFPQHVDVALENLRTGMSSAEAQRRLALIMIAAAFIADQMRALSAADIETDKNRGLRNALDKLSAPQVTDSINRMLEADSSLLSEETTAAIMQIFGGGHFVEGSYVPLRNDKIKDALRLPGSEA